jgi:hypothetical protein
MAMSISRILWQKTWYHGDYAGVGLPPLACMSAVEMMF